MENREYRMYGLVPYNLSPIQQGIQFGHAVVEYGIQHFHRDEYLRWAKNDKTFIILNGGTTNSRVDLETKEYVGSLNRHMKTLKQNGIPYSTFHEPDLGDQLTAVVFLVDDRVWNRKFDWEEWRYEGMEYDAETYVPLYEKTHEEWVEAIGGEKNVFLREFLSQFKLA